jgi:hypothetical protein
MPRTIEQSTPVQQHSTEPGHTAAGTTSTAETGLQSTTRNTQKSSSLLETAEQQQLGKNPLCAKPAIFRGKRNVLHCCGACCGLLIP